MSYAKRNEVFLYSWLGAARRQGNSQHILNPGLVEKKMNGLRIAGIILILIGAVGLFTGGFSFTHDKTAAKVGPLELQVKERESVNIPQWLSGGAVALGAIVLVLGFRKK